MGDSTAKLNILIQLRDEASAALSSMGNSISDLGGNLNFAGDMAGTLAGALSAIGASAIIGTSLKAFSDAQAQMARFDAIVKTLPPGLQQFRDAMIKAGDDALMKFGFDNEEATLSLAKLMQATQDAPMAFEAFQAAIDLARYKNISLEDATQALTIAFMGGGRMLKMFGIEVDDHASKETILAAVMDKVRGQAEANAKTFEGQMRITMSILGEFQEALGAQFAPAITFVNEKFHSLIESVGGLNEVLTLVRPVLIAVAVILTGVVVVAVYAAVAAFLAMIGVGATFIAALAAIGGAIALFATVWQIGWQGMKDIFVFVWTSIKNFFVGIWNTLISTVQSAMNTIKGYLNGIVDTYNSVKNTITQPIKSVVNSVGNFVSNVLPFASGGIVTRPTLGLVGEAGPEAIIPLSRMGGLGGGQIVINLQGDFYTDTEIAERFANRIASLIKYQLKM